MLTCEDVGCLCIQENYFANIREVEAKANTQAIIDDMRRRNVWPFNRVEHEDALRQRCVQLQTKHDEMEQDLAKALLENATIKKEQLALFAALERYNIR